MPEEGFEKFEPFVLKNMITDSNHSVFRLPRNQRKYSWGKKHRIEMWDDLKRFREILRDEHDRYYFGNIVTAVERDGDNFVKVTHESDNRTYERAEIFDGQQRMTTLTILAAAIRDVCLDMVLFREEINENLTKEQAAREGNFNGRTGKTPVEEHAEALENSQSAEEYYAPYDATAAEADAAGFDGRTGKTAVEEHAEALEGDKTAEEYYQPFRSRQEQDEEARALGFNGDTGVSPRIERRRAERAGQNRDEYYAPYDATAAEADAAGFDGRTGKTPAEEHAEAKKKGEDSGEYYRRIIFEDFPRIISEDPSMDNPKLNSMRTLVDRIDQDVIKSSEGLDDLDFGDEGSGLEARIRYLELTGRGADDERLKWVQLTKEQRAHHFAGENRETGFRPNAGNYNIYNCYDYFFEQCKKEIQRDILYDNQLERLDEIKNPRNIVREFYKAIFEKTVLTEARVVGSGAAYRIFGTLNDRGIPLFETDKLRNTIMSKLMEYGKNLDDDEYQNIAEELENYWEIVWEKDAKADDILRDWYNASRDDVETDRLTDGEESEYPKIVAPIRGKNNPLEIGEGAKLGVTLHRIIETRLQDKAQEEDGNDSLTTYVEFTKDFSKIIHISTEHSRNPFSWCLEVTDAKLQTVIEYAILFRQHYINDNLEQYEGFRPLTDEQINTIKKIVLSYSLALWKPFEMKRMHEGEDTTRYFQRWARLLLHEQDPADVISTMKRDCRIFLNATYTVEGKNIKDEVIERITSHKWSPTNNNPAKSLLYSIEEHLRPQAEEQLHAPDILDLEHILPQSVVGEDPDDNAQWWIDHVGVEVEELQRLVYSIGNMTLLHNRTNRSVGNRKFCIEEGDPPPADNIPDDANFIEVADGEGYYEMEEINREGVGVIKHLYSHKRATIRNSNLRLNRRISEEGHPHILPYVKEEELIESEMESEEEEEFDFDEWKDDYEFNRWKLVEIKARSRALAESAWDMMRVTLDLSEEEEEAPAENDAPAEEE